MPESCLRYTVNLCLNLDEMVLGKCEDSLQYICMIFCTMVEVI